MHKFTKLLAALLVIGAAGPASAIQYKISGDMNHRLELYNDQANMYNAAESISPASRANTPVAVLRDGTVGETWGEIKYRLTFEASTDDKAVRGVYGIEVGGVKFGRAGGGSYSGDGLNVETRFAYIDFQLVPKHRMSAGLQPFAVNKFLWNETAMGLQLKGGAGPVNYTLGWGRGIEVLNTATNHQQFRDADNLFARGDFVPMKDTKLGVFAVYQRARPEVTPTATVAANRSYLLKFFNGVNYDLYDIGADAALKLGDAFVNLDVIYQGGSSEVVPTVGAARDDLDHSAFVAHADLGYNFGPARITYSGWYATGDEDAADGDVENFIATDVDFADSIIFFEGGYTDDNYFTEAPYFLDKGAFFNKLALDYKASPKLTLSGAVLYVLSAEDFRIGPGAAGTDDSNELGWEIDAAVSYKINPNLELAWNAGYLLAGDAMDAFEQNKNGEADRNIFRTTARMRYMF